MKEPRIYRDFREAGAVCAYAYRDEQGTVLYQVWRILRVDGHKTFLQAQPVANGWQAAIQGVRRVPYRLPELLAADLHAPVLYCEGEKDADNLAALGFVTTTNAMGAGKWLPEYGDSLWGRHVVVLLDNDPDGEKHGRVVAAGLHGIAASVRLLRLPGLPAKGDVSDWLATGGTANELNRRIAEAPVWQEPSTDAQSENPSSPSAPAFPVDALPPAVRAYVTDAAASLSCPLEMIAVPMLGFAGSTIGNRLHLVLKHSYREYPTLYLAIVAPPGSAKTPALNLAQWPIDALQNDAERDYRERKARYEEDLDTWRQSKDHDKPAKPHLRDYFSSNLTLEALIGMFDRAPGVAIIRDEILGWVSSMDQYRSGKGSDRQEYLSLWSAKTIKLDRKGADPIYRRYPVACIVGGIQPDLVGGLHNQAQQRDGFVERLLPIVPDVAPMPWSEDSISPGRYTDVLEVFRAIDRLPPAALANGDGNSVGLGVELTPAARRIYVSWFNENQALIAAATGIAAGFYAKLPAHVARLALILHALWSPDDPRGMVAAERMEDAIELGEFFRAHITRFLALLRAPAPAQCAGLEARLVRILRMAKSNTDSGWATRSDLLRRLGNVKTDELTPALDRLHGAGTIERRARTTATKPVEEWRLTPESDIPHASKYSNYSPADGSEAPNGAKNVEYCEYCESPNRHEPPIVDADYEEVLV